MITVPLAPFQTPLSSAKNFDLFQQSLEAAPIQPAAFVSQSTRTNQSFRGHGREGSNGFGQGCTDHGGSYGCGDGFHTTNGRRHIPRCQICRQEGHYADACPNRYSPNCQPAPTSHLVEAFDASCFVSQPSASDWYLDIGASAHMTPFVSTLDAT